MPPPEKTSRKSLSPDRGQKIKSSRRPSGSARSPTGMPGRNMANTSHRDPLPCSPLRLLNRLGLTLLSVSRFLVPGTRVSQRRFARPRGCVLSDASTRGHRSPPTASTQFRLVASSPFGSLLPASLRVSKRLRGADPYNVPVAGCSIRNSLTVFSPCSPLGPRPSGSALGLLPTREVHHSPRSDLRSLPAAASAFVIGGFRSSFPVRYRLPGLLFLLTSWNLLHNAPEAFVSQR